MITFTGIVVLVFLGVSTVRREQKLSVARREYQYLDEKVVELQSTQTELEKQANYFQSNAYIEQQARLKLNYKKPDEHVVYVYRSASTPTPHDQALAKPVSNLQQWWEYVMRD